jgi:hypothetical protein
MGLVAFASRHFGQRGNLSSPRTAFLAVGEDDVAIDYRGFHGNSSKLGNGTRLATRWHGNVRAARQVACSAWCGDPVACIILSPALSFDPVPRV